jgi:hypothetical protein
MHLLGPTYGKIILPCRLVKASEASSGKDWVFRGMARHGRGPLREEGLLRIMFIERLILINFR